MKGFIKGKIKKIRGVINGFFCINNNLTFQHVQSKVNKVVESSSKLLHNPNLSAKIVFIPLLKKRFNRISKKSIAKLSQDIQSINSSNTKHSPKQEGKINRENSISPK